MKKKILVVVAIIVAVGLCAAAVIWIVNESKYVEPECLEPEVFEKTNFDTDLLIGLWNENTVYYRFNDDGSGVTWDLSDDLVESEGTKMKWELERGKFILYYTMEIGCVIPKLYNMNKLELDVLEYYDDFGVEHKLSRVEELYLIN